jgi:hypothetical protein
MGALGIAMRDEAFVELTSSSFTSPARALEFPGSGRADEISVTARRYRRRPIVGSENGNGAEIR